MIANLSILNRLSLLGLLPVQGDKTTLKIIREMREELSLSEQEHSVLKIRPTGEGKITFDEKAVPDKKFVYEGIREVIVEEVKTQLKQMEKEKKLLLDYLSLYEVLIE